MKLRLLVGSVEEYKELDHIFQSALRKEGYYIKSSSASPIKEDLYDMTITFYSDVEQTKFYNGKD